MALQLGDDAARTRSVQVESPDAADRPLLRVVSDQVDAIVSEVVPERDLSADPLLLEPLVSEGGGRPFADLIAF